MQGHESFRIVQQKQQILEFTPFLFKEAFWNIKWTTTEADLGFYGRRGCQTRCRSKFFEEGG